MNYSSQASNLLRSQIQEWELARQNYEGLKKVKSKILNLPGGSSVMVQFNPERIRSSAAKVDAKSIQERLCFLCEKNRPVEQEGIGYGDYTILINPFPIFAEHLTVPRKEHTLQLIAPHFPSMLELASELNEFTLFYNGPKCGASAPDHFHFQAGIKGFMPVEADFRDAKFAQLIAANNDVEVYNWRGYNRGVVTFTGSNAEGIASLFEKLYELLASNQPDEVEPMLNVLAYYEDGNYVVHIFPRILHRPACYFAEGKDQILISPASVDMGGVFITPRQSDYDKITSADVLRILDEVCMKQGDLDQLIRDLVQSN